MTKKMKLCIGLVALLAILAIGAILLMQTQNRTGTIARIIQDGQCIKTIDLSQVEEPYEFTVTGTDNASNTIRVMPGKIAIISATCPDKICVNAGPISDSLRPITCLPNHLVIRIDKENDSGLDGVSG